MVIEAREADPYFFDDDELKPEPEVKQRKKKYSTPYGPRYTVGMRSDTDPCCYKDFFETEKLSEAKEKADEAVAKYGKAVIVWDRLSCPSDVYRVEPSRDEQPMVAGVVTPGMKLPKKGKKKK